MKITTNWHILGPRYVFEMMGFDLICKIPQIQTHYDFNYDYDSHWQIFFFAICIGHAGSFQSNLVSK